MRCTASIEKNEFVVESFEIFEEVSVGFKCKVLVKADIKINIGDEIRIKLDQYFWSGLVESIAEFYTSTLIYYYEITLCSHFEFYLKSRRYSIYEDMTLDVLLDKILQPLNYSFPREITKKYDYLVQYDQSDLGFIQYLIAANDMYYYVDHRLNKLIISKVDRLEQTILYFTNIRQFEKIHSYFDQIKMIEGQGNKKFISIGFNQEKPEVILRNELESGDSANRSTYYSTDLLSMKEVENRNLYIKNMFGKKCVINTHNPAIRAGSEVMLADSPHDGLYFVNKVVHKYSRDSYNNEIVISKYFIPSNLPRLNKVTGIETATVSEGRYLKDGKIKVNFHWQDSPNSQAYLPILTGICGNGWGSSFIPRSGQRVAVSFECGDASRPFICGSFYDGSHVPPHGDDPLITGFKSENSNEIIINDSQEKGEMFINVAKDLKEKINDNKIVSIGGNFEQKISNGSSLVHLASDNKSVEYKIKIELGNSITEVNSGSHFITTKEGNLNLETRSGEIIMRVENGKISIFAPLVSINSELIELKSNYFKLNAKSIDMNSEDDFSIKSPSIKISTIQ